MEEKKPNIILKRERELRGWSQRTVAERAQTTEQVVCRWESGRHKPNRYFQTQLCQLFGKSAEELGFMGELSLSKTGTKTEQKLWVDTQKEPDELDLEYQRNTPVDKKFTKLLATSTTSPISSSTKQRASKELEEQGMRNEGRRQLMQQALNVAGTAMVSSSPLLEQFARVLARPSTIDEATFSYLETRTAHYWGDRHSAMVTSSLLLEYVLEHLEKILTFLECSLLPSERKRLCALASGAAQLIGHLFFDLGDYRNARNFHKKAIQAAQETDNIALEAAAWGRMSFTWSYSGNVQKALPCIQQARSLAVGKTAQVVQAYLASVEAEIQAMLHNREASLKALGEANYINEQPDNGENLYWLRFDRSRLEGYQGACFRHFYRPEDPQTEAFLTQAQKALKDALALLSPSMIQRRPALLIDLARTFTQQSEIEEACEHAVQAIIILAQLQSRIGIRRLLTLRQDLEPWLDTPHVKKVDEHLEALLPE